jgi:uncharacterized protein YybS (DUF2232 family)
VSAIASIQTGATVHQVSRKRAMSGNSTAGRVLCIVLIFNLSRSLSLAAFHPCFPA